MRQSDKHKAAYLGLAIIMGLTWPASIGAQDTTGLPGGASSLTETYGDWRVACQVVETAKRCAMLQQQLRQDGQRVVTVELQTAPDNMVAGNLVLPFGLQLNSGVVLQVDEQPAFAQLSFQTCLPVGCLVQLRFDAAAVSTLRAGAQLEVSTKAADTGQEFVFSVSLNGFTTALDRVANLSGS